MSGSFVDATAVAADLHGLTIVTLLGHQEFDPAVPVPIVVPADK